MDLKVPETLHVDAFQMRFADVADVDLEQLHALSISVRWPHRAEDWQYLRQLGHGFVALDEIGRVMGSSDVVPPRRKFRDPRHVDHIAAAADERRRNG
jgi:hypothetical protein